MTENTAIVVMVIAFLLLCGWLAWLDKRGGES